MPYGPGTDNPLMNADGSSRVAMSPGSSVTPRWLTAIAGASEPNTHRHARARRGGARAGRRLSVRMDEARGAEVAAVLEAWGVTAGGAVGTAWWPPGFGEGTAEAAPRWSFVERPSIERVSSTKAVVAFEVEERV